VDTHTPRSLTPSTVCSSRIPSRRPQCSDRLKVCTRTYLEDEPRHQQSSLPPCISLCRCRINKSIGVHARSSCVMNWQHMLSSSLVQPKGLRGPLPSRAAQVCAFVIEATHAYYLFFEPWPVVALSRKLSPLHANRHAPTQRAACMRACIQSLTPVPRTPWILLPTAPV
jgi:hypothetical protein